MAALTLDFKNLDLALTNIENFVKDIFSGNDEGQKLKVLKKLKDLPKLYKLSKPKVVKRTFEIEKKAELVPSKKSKMDIETKIPDEIWLRIIQNLSTNDMLGKFALVNKRFNRLTKDLSLFKTFHLNGLSDNSKIDLVPVYRKFLMKLKKLMKKLIIEDTLFGMGEAIFEVLKSNKTLKYLQIKETKICDLPPKFQKFIKNTNIETLYLENISLRTYQIHQISKFKTLKHLKVRLPNKDALYGFDYFISGFIEEIEELTFPTLETLCILPSNKMPKYEKWFEPKCQELVSSKNFPCLKSIQIGNVIKQKSTQLK